jgi:hypothetical protein
LEVSEGRWRLIQMRTVMLRKVLISTTVAALLACSQAGADADALGPTREALVAHGVRHFTTRAMREGLAELERAVAASPDWEPGRRALACALIRGGIFERAAEEFTSILGSSLAGAIEAGEVSGRRLPEDTDADALLGLAIARAESGDHAAADRLYRSYADVVGPETPAAAWAFWRLAEMYETSGVGWGDPAAERLKALALDPDVARAIILPSFPDAASVPELEPYTRPVEAAAGRDHPPDGYDSLPVLIRWTAAAGIDPASPSLFQRRAEAEMLVDEDGTVREVVLPPDALEGSAKGEAAAAAALEWLFRPAVAIGEPVAAWISLEVDVPLGAAPDSLATGGQPVPEDAPAPDDAR